MPDFLGLTDWSVLLTGTVAVFAGSAIQGCTGLGLGMVAAPILVLIEPDLVPGPLLVLAFVISALMTHREWRSVDRKTLLIALCGRMPGTIMAGLTIALIPNSVFELVFGGLVLLAVALSAGGWRVAPTTQNLLLAGFASGYMGTITSVGAPPLALAYQRSTPAEQRSTMAAFFLGGSAFSLLALAYFGRFSSRQMVASAIFLPPLIIGFWVSGYAVAHIDQRVARLSVLWLSGISAAALIIKSLFSNL